MNLFLLTDLEGVAGVTRFAQTREEGPLKEAARRLLTAEVNAVVRGIRAHDPTTEIHAWDGHGSGGLDPEALAPDVHYLPPQRVNMETYFRAHAIDALLFVGQHAMAYTRGGNLCHTMSSRHVEFYQLNGTQVGEFGLRATLAGELGVPTIFLSGDAAACAEARALVPAIVTVAVKEGTGWESAECLPPRETRALLETGVQRALARRDAIPPVAPPGPVVLEITSKDFFHALGKVGQGGTRVDLKTVRFEAPDLLTLARRGII